MNVYLVRHGGPHRYDAYDAHVVIAFDPAQARALCARNPGDEGRLVWADAAVEFVGRADSEQARILLSSFRAG